MSVLYHGMKNIQSVYAFCPNNTFEIYRAVKWYSKHGISYFDLWSIGAIWVGDYRLPAQNTSLVKTTSLLP